MSIGVTVFFRNARGRAQLTRDCGPCSLIDYLYWKVAMETSWQTYRNLMSHFWISKCTYFVRVSRFLDRALRLVAVPRPFSGLVCIHKLIGSYASSMCTTTSTPQYNVRWAAMAPPPPPSGLERFCWRCRTRRHPSSHAQLSWRSCWRCPNHRRTASSPPYGCGTAASARRG